MSVQEINTRVRTALAMGESAPENSILEDSAGPLWDRGWVGRAQDPENTAQLDAVLNAFEAKRMVLAHTPIASIVVPRFDGKVLMADVGLSEHYGNGFAALEIIDDEVTMLLGDQRLAVPDSADEFDAYFDAAQALVSDPEKIIRYRELIKQAVLEAEAAKKAQQAERQESVQQ